MKTQEKGIMTKKSHSSIGRDSMLIFDVWVSLNPQTPFLVKIISQIIKKVAVINIEGKRYLNFEAYLNLLSHDASRGKEIVKRSNWKYNVTYNGLIYEDKNIINFLKLDTLILSLFNLSESNNLILLCSSL